MLYNWEHQRYVILQHAGHLQPVTAVRLCGDTLITGSADHSLKTWQLGTMECTHTYTSHRNVVTGVGVTEDGALVSVSADRYALSHRPASNQAGERERESRSLCGCISRGSADGFRGLLRGM